VAGMRTLIRRGPITGVVVIQQREGRSRRDAMSLL
jgi:hypothetical protein